MRDFHRLERIAGRIVSIFITMLLLVVTASAYTIVMRGGRRIEIPSRFVVTSSTLTYEVSPGIQITLEMATIDIPATEKANGERPGSLLRRVQLSSRESSNLTKSPERNMATPAGRRTITNRDLEASMRRRRESELAYESRRKQLGLPSLEESRKRAAAESDLISRELEQKLVDERESESYWRSRASALRTEIAALDAELQYIRLRLDEVPFPALSGSFGTFSSIVPFIALGNLGGGRSFPVPMARRPNVFVAPSGGPQLTGHFGLDRGTTQAQVFLNPGNFPRRRPFGIAAPFLGFPNVTVFGSSLQPYDFTYERSALITRFNELAAMRAGLNARWRELEDEARRAGVPPGWLRP